MRLADFINGNTPVILAQWEAFAASQLPAAASMTSLALRDHGQEILAAITADLATEQSRDEQVAKSQGDVTNYGVAVQTAAHIHGLLRAESGFDIKQLAGEYRALRASVLRLWMDDCSPHAAHQDDVVRFNEAIDQAVAESIDFFDRKIEESRHLFMGMLGHDMRTPLQAIQLTALYLGRLNKGTEVSAAATRLTNSSTRLQRLLDDLVGFNRARLGLGITLAPKQADLAEVLGDEIDELRKAHPDARIEVEVSGRTDGLWDAPNLQRVLGNLVENSVKYAHPGEPVRVVLTGTEHHVTLEVRNPGPAIDQAEMAQLFDPLKRGTYSHGDGKSLGLGLFICRMIAQAHGGDISGTGDAGDIVFSVKVPRSATSDRSSSKMNSVSGGEGAAAARQLQQASA